MHFSDYLLIFAPLTLFNFNKQPADAIFCKAYTHNSGAVALLSKGAGREDGVDDVLEGAGTVIQHPTLTTTPLVTLQREQPDAIMLSLMSAMDLISQGIPLVNIFQDSMNSSNLLISRWDNDPLKMKSKKVAIYNADPNYLAYILNKKERLDYQIIRCTSHINLFLSGAIDATMATSYNEYLQLLQAGFKMSDESIYRFGKHDYNIQEQGVYVTRGYYEAHPDVCKQFAVATRRGWEWVADHPKEALDIVMKYVHSDLAATNRTLQRRMLQEVLNQQIDADSKKREFRVRRDMVQKANKLMLECGLLKRAVTYEEVIAP